MSSPSENTQGTKMSAGLARMLVAVTSGAVLVLEILAGRLLAPYVGVSLETFTGIIGVVLAGIALGSWGGGVLADQREPQRLIGPVIMLGGALGWLALPVVRVLGPQFGSGVFAIVVLTTAAFLLPATVLSAVGPLVAKVRLQSLADTGAVVGGLSAAGTVGALLGTFLTGFVLVRALPTRPVVILVGVVLVVLGAWVHWRLHRQTPSAAQTAASTLGVVAALALGVSFTPPCQYETGYACVNIRVSEDNPSGRSLYLDRARHAFVDIEDPTNLDVRYIRLFADAIDELTDGPLSTLHVGGGGFSLPMYLQHQRPGSVDVVLEIDPQLTDIARNELGLVATDAAGEEAVAATTGIVVRSGDARLALPDFAPQQFDLVVGDAFSGFTVPWHLTTREFMAEIDRVLTPSGFYLLNLIDSGDNGFVRAEVATAQERFAHVLVIMPASGIPGPIPQNQVVIASQRPIPDFRIDPADGYRLDGAALDAFVDGASILYDDFAPVDQLIDNS